MPASSFKQLLLLFMKNVKVQTIRKPVMFTFEILAPCLIYFVIILTRGQKPNESLPGSTTVDFRLGEWPQGLVAPHKNQAGEPEMILHYAPSNADTDDFMDKLLVKLNSEDIPKHSYEQFLLHNVLESALMDDWVDDDPPSWHEIETKYNAFFPDKPLKPWVMAGYDCSICANIEYDDNGEPIRCPIDRVSEPDLRVSQWIEIKYRQENTTYHNSCLYSERDRYGLEEGDFPEKLTNAEKKQYIKDILLGGYPTEYLYDHCNNPQKSGIANLFKYYACDAWPTGTNFTDPGRPPEYSTIQTTTRCRRGICWGKRKRSTDENADEIERQGVSAVQNFLKRHARSINLAQLCSEQDEKEVWKQLHAEHPLITITKQGHVSNDEIDDFLADETTNFESIKRTFGAIVFDKFSGGDLSYTIRLHPTRRNYDNTYRSANFIKYANPRFFPDVKLEKNWNTKNVVSSRQLTMPRQGTFPCTGDKPYYYKEGFLHLQHTINNIFVQNITESSPLDNKEIYLKKMPFGNYNRDTAWDRLDG